MPVQDGRLLGVLVVFLPTVLHIAYDLVVSPRNLGPSMFKEKGPQEISYSKIWLPEANFLVLAGILDMSVLYTLFVCPTTGHGPSISEEEVGCE